MGFILAYKVTFLAWLQVFLLGLCGFMATRRKILSEEGLNSLSQLLVKVTLPSMIFSHMMEQFDFSRFFNWWVFPLISLILTSVGFSLGFIFASLNGSLKQRGEFLSLVTFQNSGYLPLPLAAAILAPQQAEEMFIYIFLFLLGFNLAIWSFGVHLLSATKKKGFELGSLFSPPVVAIGVSFIFILLGLQDNLPKVILRPLKMVGDCTIPLGVMVVGGNLGQGVLIKATEKRTLFNLILAKLIILPTLSLFFLSLFSTPRLIGFLVILQAAMPSATSLAIISRHYEADFTFTSQGILVTHLVSLLTIPLFLTLFRIMV